MREQGFFAQSKSTQVKQEQKNGKKLLAQQSIRRACLEALESRLLLAGMGTGAHPSLLPAQYSPVKHHSNHGPTTGNEHGSPTSTHAKKTKVTGDGALDKARMNVPPSQVLVNRNAPTPASPVAIKIVPGTTAPARGNPLSGLGTIYQPSVATVSGVPAPAVLPSVQPAQRSVIASPDAVAADPTLPATVLPLQYDLIHFGGYLSAATPGTPLFVARSYLASHAADLGLAATDLASTVVTDQYTDTDTGVTHIYLRQQYNGLTITNANLVINVMSDGRVLNVGGGLVPGLSRQAASALAPTITAQEALQFAASQLKLSLTSVPTLAPTSPNAGNGRNAVTSVTLDADGVSSEKIPANLRYVWTADGLKLVWDLVIDTPDHQHWYNVSIDAVSGTGELLAGADWVDRASYNVYALPTKNPDDAARTLLTNPNDPTYSPYGWHDTNGVAGAEYTITRGNNVYAYTDINNTNSPGFSPDGTSALNFDFPVDLTQAPSTTGNQAAGVTNLFYLNNFLHDVHARYGFTEPAGNFQSLNYTGSGAGNDPVLAEAQDGGGINNANFATPADGSAPRMQMYLWNHGSPSRDGDLDNGIVIHEYGHGVSNRLTGGPANSNALTATQSGGMGEGWSDFYALMFTQRATDTQGARYPIGTWAINQAPTGTGIRRYPYSYDMSVDPETFSLYNNDGSKEVHNTGEIWATTLWDINWLLINKYGYGTNFAGGYNASTPGLNGGNNLTMKLVEDALKLQPANPSFTDARNAILAADQALNGGADQLQIWQAFARRGLGFSAVDANSSAFTITTATDIPTALLKPRVAAQNLLAVQTVAVSSIDINFSQTMNPASFSIADDITSFTGPGNVNLLSQITGSTWANANTTLHITFAPQAVDGNYSIVIGPQILAASDGSAMDQSGNGIAGEVPGDQYTATFGYDAQPLQVLSTTPVSGSLVSLPFTTVDVTFNEPFDASTVGAMDLTVSQGTVTAATVVNPTTVRYTLSGVTGEGALTLSMSTGAISKQGDGFPMLAYAGSYFADIPVRSIPTASSVAPAGSLIYQSSVTGNILTAADQDSFTIKLDAGQTLTVTASGMTSLQSVLTITDPLNQSIATKTADANGKSVVLETLPVVTAGIYTITIIGAASTTGAFALGITLNAAQQAVNFGGVANSTRDTAQNIDASFIAVGRSGMRGAVMGGPPTGGRSTQDYYSFSLNAGDISTLLLKANTSGSQGFTLLDATGTLLASGAAASSNVDQVIRNFVAPATGTYYVLLSSGSAGSAYNLVVTRNVTFALQPADNFANAQPLGNAQGALGNIGSAGLTQVTLNAVNSGWWDGSGSHNSGNQNYLVGQYSGGLGQYRDYVVFDLSGITQTIVGAQLILSNPVGGYLSGDPSEHFSLFDVSTSVPNLEAAGSGQIAIFTDLGTGAAYGSRDVSAADNGRQVNTTLNSTAINSLNGSRGLQFAFGGAITSISGSGPNEAIFGGTGGSDTRQLVLNLGNSADWYSVSIANVGNTLVFSTTTPADGPGDFTNNLNPHLEIYDPAGNLIASGVKQSDGRNELAQYKTLVAGNYRVRVAALGNTTGEYVLNRGDGLILTVPANVQETDGTVNATITATTAPAGDLTVLLASTDPTRISIPGSIILPAGQTSVIVPLSIVDDSLLNGTETVSFTASAANYFPGTRSTTLHDNESAALTVSVPATIIEGSGNLSMAITASAAPASDLVLTLSSDLSSRLTVPATVTLKAGQTTTSFIATVVDNAIIDGTQTANITAVYENWTGGTGSVAISDNDATLTVTAPAVGGWEGQTLANAGTVRIGGTLATPLVVNLTSDNASLTVPATATIPAGQTTAAFNLVFLADSLKNGTRTANVTATANGLTDGISPVIIHDSNLDHISIDSIAGPKTAGTPFGIVVRAMNIANETIAVYTGNGSLAAVGSGGSLIVSPTTGGFSAGLWNPSVTLTKSDPAVVLTATSNSQSGSSNPFVIQGGAVSTLTWGPVSSPQIANLPFSATITAKDVNGNVANGFNGNATLSGLVGSTSSQTLVGNTTYSISSSGSFTDAYRFTPTSSFQVTHVRSYFGTKVSIWNTGGTLLASQAVVSTAGTWTETALSKPITLSAGTTYVVGVFSAGLAGYYRTTAPISPAFATIGGAYYASGDAYPSSTNSGYFAVDLRANVGTFTTIPITPTTATFVNGVWTGNVNVSQAASAMHLHAVDGSAHIGDSGDFDVIQRALTLSVPSDVLESDGVVNGLLNISPASATDLTVNLTSSDPSRLSVPATIIVPAGQTSVLVPLTPIDNALVDGIEQVNITAVTAGYSDGTGAVNVHDNETAAFSINLPASAIEGDGNLIGTVNASVAPTRDIQVKLSSSNVGRLIVPATVTLKAGQTSAIFNLSIVDNRIIDGLALVTVGAAYDGWTSGFKAMTVADNDNTLALTLPVGGWEGQTLTNAGTVRIGGTLSTPLIVNLTSDNDSLAVPRYVTIPAGQTSATFTLSFVADALKNGTRTANITATASGLTNGSAPVIIHDGTVDHVAVDPIVGPKTAGTAFAITVRAFNIANEVIVNYNGTGALSAVGQAGDLPVTPAVLNFVSGIANANVTLTTADPAVVLTTTSGGSSGSSNAFVLQAGAVAGFTWGPVSTPQIANLPFGETLTAKDANGNIATGFNGTANISGLVGGFTSQTLLNSPVANSSFSTSTNYTLGYTFTPNTSIQVTAVRSYYGTKVSIWTDSGALIASQPVSGTPNVWTETALATPVTLSAGTTYRISIYTAGQTYYWNSNTPVNPTFATIGGGYYTPADGFPSTSTNVIDWMVDLRGNIGNFTAVPITPATATFVNGVWTGNVNVSQAAIGMHLHVDDGFAHTGDSANFDVIQRTLNLSLPTNVRETDGAANGLLTVSPAPLTDLTVSLTSNDPARLSVPDSIVIPAGQTSVSVPVSIIDNALLDGPQSVSIIAASAGYTTANVAVTVHDDETATLTVTLPASATEGDAPLSGSITASAAPTRDVVVQLASNMSSRLTVPSTVTLKAGQTIATFLATVIDNAVIDGKQTATVTAGVENWTSGSASVSVADNDGTIVITVIPASGGFEGQVFYNGGTVRIGGPLATDTIINLVSNNPSLVVPPSVTIFAGQVYATFDLTFLRDNLKQGSRTATLTASGIGLTNGSIPVVIHDDNLDHVMIDPIIGPKSAGSGFGFTARAMNISNEVLTDQQGSATLTATGQSGNINILPLLGNFNSGIWSTNATINAVDPAVVIAVTLGGTAGKSNAFEVQPGSVATFSWGPISTPQFTNAPFSEILTALDKGGNTATAFNGTVNLTGGVGYTSPQSLTGADIGDYVSRGDYSVGYSFTLNTDMQVTAVRSYYGQKVSIWTNTGTLLASQSYTATPGSWTETPLTTQLTLQAGIQYRIAVYTGGGDFYWNQRKPANPPFATLGFATYFDPGDKFPTYPGESYNYLVDLRGIIGISTPVSTSPGTVTFINGVATTNIAVSQPVFGMHLHVDDNAGHLSDSPAFDVIKALNAPLPPIIEAREDSGISNSDGITNFNNGSAETALKFVVGGTVGGTTVTVYSDGIAVGSAVASGASTTVTANVDAVFSEGTHVITSQATLGGMQGPVSAGTKITIITVIPAIPHTPDLRSNVDSGVSDTDNITNINTPVLEIPHATPYYRLLRSGVLISGAYATGTVFSDEPRVDGNYIYSLIAVDAAGNFSGTSPVLTVTIDTQHWSPSFTDGQFDTGFGIGGVARSGRLIRYNQGIRMAVAPDGKIIMIGDRVSGASDTYAVIRFNADGTFDTSFGGTGTVTTRLFSEQEPFSIAVQSDGKIVVFGAGGPGNRNNFTGQAFWIRYNVNGTLDTTFGTGGKSYTSAPEMNWPGPMVLLPDDKIVSAGSGETGFGPGFEIVQLNADGTRDTAFGINGIGFATGTGFDHITSLARQPDGKFMAAGANHLVRFNANGSVDTTFGVGGQAVIPPGYIQGLALQTDGKIILVGDDGTTGGHSLRELVRYLADGTRDTSFGTGGVITGLPGLSDVESLADVAVQTDGKILVGGTSQSPAYHGVVSRYTSAGALDVTFGAGGTFAAALPSGNNVDRIALLPSGQILVAGGSNIDAEPTFGNVGIIYRLTPSSLTEGPSILLDSASDHGIRNSDQITNVNTPAFNVIHGDSYFRVYRDGKVVDGYFQGGTYSASSLPDGSYNFAITAMDAAGNESLMGTIQKITIDTVAPTVKITPVIAGGTSINKVTLAFSKRVYGFDITKLQLTLNGVAVPLTAAQTLTTTDNLTWTLDNLSILTGQFGAYQLTLPSAAPDVMDLAGNLMGASNPAIWTMNTLNFSGNFYLQLDANQTTVNIWRNSNSPGQGIPDLLIPLTAIAQLSQIIASGSAGDDKITLDFSNGNPLPALGMSIDGGNGKNTISVIGTSGSDTLTAAATGLTFANAAGTVPITIQNIQSLEMVGGTGAADALIVTGGTFNINADTSSGNPRINVTAKGALTRIAFNSTQHLASLTLGEGASADVMPADSHDVRRVLVTSALTIDATGKLDLFDNDMIIRNSSFANGKSGVLAVRDLTLAGRGAAPGGFVDGVWNGSHGITSTAARLTAQGSGVESTALGYALNGDMPFGAYTTFDGQDVGANDILIKYTYNNDSDLNGIVDDTDVSIQSLNYGAAALQLWYQGDCNGDGVVNDTEVSNLSLFYGYGVAGSAYPQL